jgi:beta-glucanase (GH16 family)
MVFSDDFGGSSLGNRWGLHEGQPGGDQYSLWRPSHVQVADGMLHLVASRSGDQWVTGGVSNWESSQTYGKWDVRFRIDRSDEITYALLLWPQDEKWPPEIDFAEDAGGDRATTTATLHHRPGDQKVQRSLQGDFSVWHTVGVEWQPGEIRYTIDGRPWSTVVSDQVPDVPMWLGIQTQAGGCSKGFLSCPVAGTPARAELQVDWVTVYAPA